MSKALKFVSVIIVTACIVALVGGVILPRAITKQALPQKSPDILPSTHEAERKIYETTILINKTFPNQVLIISKENENGVYSAFFDGTQWFEQTNQILDEWNYEPHSANGLQNSLQGKLALADNELAFASNALQNEISSRNEISLTEFISAGDAAFTINGKSYQAYIAYARKYTTNNNALLFSKKIYFWDRLGNFYFVDTNRDINNDPLVPRHSLGVIKTTDQAVKKTFDVLMQNQANNQLQVVLSTPVNQTLVFNQLNYTPNGQWGMLSGTLNISGIGILKH